MRTNLHALYITIYESPQQSYAHPILQLLKDISNANDKNSNDVTLAVYLDSSKAFDTIRYKILINKL